MTVQGALDEVDMIRHDQECGAVQSCINKAAGKVTQRFLQQFDKRVMRKLVKAHVWTPNKHPFFCLVLFPLIGENAKT